ncbi:MAG: TonB-dependent receptor, partial [Gammaproteobacteria bacterium]|nr:TonB-dependent receptor [Gammaproteobacteria bacterium]
MPESRKHAGVVDGDSRGCGMGQHAASVLGTVVLATSMLTLPSVMLLTSRAVMAQQDALLEEIIVTARKREESALEIPESLATFSGTLVDRANINGLEDIGLLIPNLYMGRRLDGFPNVSIRGLGAFGNTQGVGFYLDDVQVFSDASSRFGDFERIEVLKGPQGILYGGANIGGAVKFVAKRPDPEAFSGRIKLRAGEDNFYDGEVHLNMPLANTWAARIFGFAKTDDSFLVNPNSPRLNGGVNDNDPDVGKSEEYGVRATLAGNITDQFSAYATVRYNDLDGPSQIWNREISGNLTHSPVVDTSFNPPLKRETVAGSLELVYEFDKFNVTSITSYTDTDRDESADLDLSQEFILDLFRPHRLNVLTQELRFTSTGAGPLQWQTGAYFLEYRRKMDSVLLVRGGFGFLDPTCCPVPPPLDASEQAVLVTIPFEDNHQEREQVAGFANASYRWNNLELAGGFRVDRWESERTNRETAIAGRQAETEVLGRGSLAWFFDNERSMVYG